MTFENVDQGQKQKKSGEKRKRMRQSIGHTHTHTRARARRSKTEQSLKCLGEKLCLTTVGTRQACLTPRKTEFARERKEKRFHMNVSKADG